MSPVYRDGRMHGGWFSLFIGNGFMLLIFIVANYYAFDPLARRFLLNAGFLAGATGGLFFLYIMEQDYLGWKRRPLTATFALIFSLFLAFVLISIAFPGMVEFGGFLGYVFWGPLMVAVVLYCFGMLRRSRGRVKRGVYMKIAGILIYLFGVTLSNDACVRYFGLPSWLVGDSLQLFGFLLIAHFALIVKDFKELDWKHSLESLYFIYKGGLLIYKQEVGESDSEDDDIDAFITAGTLESSIMAIDSVIIEGNLKVVTFNDKKILFERGEHVTVVMVATQVLDSLKQMLHDVTVEFESFFSEVLPSWDGDGMVFAPARVLVEKFIS